MDMAEGSKTGKPLLWFEQELLTPVSVTFRDLLSAPIPATQTENLRTNTITGDESQRRPGNLLEGNPPKQTEGTIRHTERTEPIRHTGTRTWGLDETDNTKGGAGHRSEPKRSLLRENAPSRLVGIADKIEGDIGPRARA